MRNELHNELKQNVWWLRKKLAYKTLYRSTIYQSNMQNQKKSSKITKTHNNMKITEHIHK